MIVHNVAYNYLHEKEKLLICSYIISFWTLLLYERNHSVTMQFVFPVHLAKMRK